VSFCIFTAYPIQIIRNLTTMTRLFLITCSLIFIASCSPKSSLPAPEASVPQPGSQTIDMSNLSPCPNWLTLPNQDDVTSEYILYRDAIKANNYTKAFEGWKKVFAVAPAADGKRSTVFDDGIRIYTKFFEEAHDTTLKRDYVNKVLDLYDQIAKCYPTGANVDAQKAFQYYYSFPGYASDDSIFALFRKALDKDGLKADYFILNPFTALLIQQFLESKITLAETQKYATQVRQILENGLKNCKTPKECDPWNAINDYVPARLADMEGVEDFYDCAYYKNKYFKDFEAAPADCDAINTTFGRLRWAKCPDTDEGILALKAARDLNCKPAVVEVKQSSMSKAIEVLNDGNYRQAIELFKTAIDETEDNNRKAELSMIISRIYYGNLRNFPESRRWSLVAANLKPGWGEPYINIGKLYASSGPLCGPGRGYESQMVVWPAIDKWNYAKSIDPSSASEANKLINQYNQYMPTREDIFQRVIEPGSTIKVGCWIQETTIVRTIK